MPQKSYVRKVDGKNVIILMPARERFAQEVGHGMDGRNAMRVAEYAEHTIRSKGPSWLLNDPLVAARIEQIQDKLMSGVKVNIRKELLKVPKLLSKSIAYMEKVLDGKDEEGESFGGDQHKTRIALRILAVGEALMIAEIPKRYEVYKVSIAMMAQQAKEDDSGDVPYIDTE